MSEDHLLLLEHGRTGCWLRLVSAENVHSLQGVSSWHSARFLRRASRWGGQSLTLDMRAGTEAALARVVLVFGAARPHHAYLFANRRANRMKVLVHDGIGVWLAARRLNSGKFAWPKNIDGTLTLSRPQFDALVLGLPWQLVGEAGVITTL